MMNGRHVSSRHAMKFVILIFVGLAIGIGSALTARADDAQRATIESLATASEALGGPVPEVRELPPGLKLRAVGVDPAASPNRAVHLSYGTDARYLALLTVSRGNIKSTDVGEHLAFGAADVVVTSRDLSDGTRDVGYAWNAGAYAIVLHVNLSNGLNREIADQMARSIR